MTIFVDRDIERARLASLVDRVVREGPAILVVTGSAGMGKSALLGRFGTEFATARQWRRGRVVSVRCHNDIGTANAYGPILDALAEVAPKSRQRLRMAADIAAQSGFEFVAGAVPGVGPALRAGVGVVQQHRADQPGQELLTRLPQEMAKALLDQTGPGKPLVLLIDDAHLIDPSSCAVIDGLTTADHQNPLALVLALRPEELSVSPTLRDTLERLTISGRLENLPLAGFDGPAVHEYTRAAAHFVPTAEQTRFLGVATGGHPIFLAQYLTLLREGGALPDPGHVLDSVEAVLRQRIRRVDSDIVEVLVIGATEGIVFTTQVVHQLADRSLDEVAALLHRARVDFGLIRQVAIDAWFGAHAEAYEFDHELLRQLFYRRQSSLQQRRRHATIAEVLQDLADTRADAPQIVHLEIVRHHHLGGNHRQAATRALTVARQLAGAGSSLAEAEQLCRTALSDIRRVERSVETDRLRVEIIELLLLTTEHGWSNTPEYLATTPLDHLAVEANDAAERSGDPVLLVRCAALRGRVAHKIHGVDAALTALSRAVELAEQTGDPTVLFLTRSAYAREFTKRDLEQGLAVLLSAHRLAQDTPAIIRDESPAVRHAVLRTEIQVGISLLDAGRLGPAERHLDSAVARLRSGDDFGTLPAGLNYLAQAQITIGLWPEARATLHEALSGPATGASAWHAYNVALLGSLLLDLGEHEAALSALRDAWEETRRTLMMNVATLVCNHYVAGLLHRGDDALDHAHQLLEWNLTRCRAAGLVRSEIAALVLFARLLMLRGNPDGALGASTEAVALLDRRGPQPALRSEEVLYQHSIVLTAVRRDREADAARERARRIVLEKAQTLDQPLRRRYLTVVPLNAALFP